MKKTLYEILEVAPDANAEAIRESYLAIPVEWIRDLPNRPRTPFPTRSQGDPRAR